MEEYRAYMMGHDDQITSRIDIRCWDWEEARLLAKNCVIDYAVELGKPIAF